MTESILKLRFKGAPGGRIEARTRIDRDRYGATSRTSAQVDDTRIALHVNELRRVVQLADLKGAAILVPAGEVSRLLDLLDYVR